jgi:hypothetical protein
MVSFRSSILSPFQFQECKSIVRRDELVAIDTVSCTCDTPHVRRTQSSDTSRTRACAAITGEREDTKMLQAAVDLRRLLGLGVAGHEGCENVLGTEIDGLQKVLCKVACTWRDLASALEEEDFSTANISFKLDAAIHGFNELTGYVVGTHGCMDTQVCYVHAVIALLSRQPLGLDRLARLMQVRACVCGWAVASQK